MKRRRLLPRGLPFAFVARSMARERQGTFAVTFSLMAPILILLIGLGLDYLNGLSFKSRWDTASDAAALAAVKVAETYATANAATMSASSLIANAESQGIAAGTKAFNANAGISEITGSVTPTVTMTQVGTEFTATATYTGSIGTRFGGLVGVSQFAVNGTSTATATSTTYINYYILVDISQSMGVGATATDMTNLYNITNAMGYSSDNEPGCVYGCHVAENNRPLTNEQVAHNNGITLRIDSAKSAIQEVINQAQNLSITGNIKIGLYTLQLNPTTNSSTPQTVQSMTNTYSALTSADATIDLGPNTVNGYGDSDMVDSITNFTTNILQSNGTGFTAASPKNYVFVITDGMMDMPGWCTYTYHCTGAIPSTACAQMQQKATVGVIYTTYLPIYEQNDPSQGLDPLYSLLVQPYASQLQPNLQACASGAGYFFQADDGPALVSAMRALFASTASALRISL